MSINLLPSLQKPTLRRHLTKVMAAGLMAFTFVACSDDPPVTPQPVNEVAKHPADVALAWTNLNLKLVEKTPGYSPMVAARAFGYIGVTLYQAVVPGIPEHSSLVGKLNDLTSVPAIESGKTYHWPSVANAAMARITKDLFPTATAEYAPKIDSMENAWKTTYASAAAADVIARSISYGQAVADAIFEYSKTDGGHEGYSKNFPTSYTPPMGPGAWEPTPRRGGAPQKAMHPYWGQNRPFILAKGNPNLGVDPGAPPAWSTDPGSPMYQDGLEVYTTVQGLTPERLATALYWADNGGESCTPAGHSVSIMVQCIKAKGLMLDEAAEGIMRMGVGVNDAFIACWEAKFRYNLMRPLTYIQKYIEPTWNRDSVTDPLNTPPFPEYPSGHSVQSGTACQVLSDMFGPAYAFTDRTHEYRGAGYGPRPYATFLDFANEAAISRLYAGIHYRAAIEKGMNSGIAIGKKIGAMSLHQ